MKTLIIGPAWIGDMVMSQSLYITLKKQQPDMQLHVMAPRWCLPLLSRMPEIDNAIEMPLGHGALQLHTRWKLGRELKKQQYQHAIILPNSFKSALIPLFACIPKRTGWKGECRYGLLNDLRLNKNAFPLMVERYLALAYTFNKINSSADLETIPYPQLRIDYQLQQETIAKLGLPYTKPILGLCPGAEFGPAKRWPEKYYAEIAERWIKTGGQVWIFGSHKDLLIANLILQNLPISQQSSCYLLAGKTSLEEAIDLLAACTKVISNDSGLMHITAAVKTPLLAIYGSTSLEYTPPLTDTVQIAHTDISCRPCFNRECPLKHLDCLNKLEPNFVWKKLLELKESE